MKKLYELLKIRQTKGDFGVEIECEGANINADCPAGWKAVDDGSLRGNFPDGRCEFVFTQPAGLDVAIDRLADLADAQRKAKLDFSFRTSVHVHVNCQQMIWPEYCAFLYTSLLMEDILSRYCGDVRMNNRFCLRVSDAEDIIAPIMKMFKQGENSLFDIRENDVRYGFINMAATLKYGSLEFRGMRGTLDVEVLSIWLRALHNIRTFAVKAGNPRAVHDLFVKMRPQDFISEVLGDVTDSFATAESVNDVRKTFSLTLELPYSYNEEKAKADEEGMVIMRGGDGVIAPDALRRALGGMGGVMNAIPALRPAPPRPRGGVIPPPVRVNRNDVIYHNDIVDHNGNANVDL
jgi:hypothetical protein